MSFMQQQVTNKQQWVEIDGTNGITFLPTDIAGTSGLQLGESTDEEEILEHYEDYYEGTIHTVGLIEGFGARLSAPGYMDCTEWSVFDTEEEAKAHLEEMYGDGEDEDDTAADTMYVVVYSPSSDEIYLSRQLAPDEVMDERKFADEVARGLGMEIEEPNGYIPNCSGDIRVEFRPDADNPVHIWSGESFYFKREE